MNIGSCGTPIDGTPMSEVNSSNGKVDNFPKSANFTEVRQRSALLSYDNLLSASCYCPEFHVADRFWSEPDMPGRVSLLCLRAHARHGRSFLNLGRSPEGEAAFSFRAGACQRIYRLFASDHQRCASRRGDVVLARSSGGDRPPVTRLEPPSLVLSSGGPASFEDDVVVVRFPVVGQDRASNRLDPR